MHPAPHPAAAEAESSPHRRAYRQAYELLERVQGEDHVVAAAELTPAMYHAEHAGWRDVRFMLQVAEVVHRMSRIDPEVLRALTADLTVRAESLPGPYTAIALGLSAVACSDDAARLIGLASRAVARLDEESQPSMARCLGYVIAAAAFNSLNLWELADDLYRVASDLGAVCDEALQTDAIAINRVLIRTEWALSLVENGDEAAQSTMAGVLEAVSAALDRGLRPLWRADVLACWDIVRVLGCQSDLELAALLPAVRTSVASYRTLLLDGGDLETLPSLDATLALAEQRAGDPALAMRLATELQSTLSLSSGVRSFPLWARAQVLAADLPAAVAGSQREYAQLVSRMRWQSRAAVLASARAQIAAERRRSEHDRLQLAVETDELTGLQNRRVFDRALRAGSGPTAMLLLDIDGFKPINDTYGHHVGDEVLRRIGRLMRQNCRAEDLAIRQGGDEFALILQGDTVSHPAATELARRLAASIRAEAWADVADELTVTVSIGLSVGSIDSGRMDGDGVLADARMLYLSADAALYESKRSGGPVTVATPARLAS